MSSTNVRENPRTRSGDYPSCSGIVRRMISLPRSILGGLRAMGNGIDFMGNRERRNQLYPPAPPPPPLLPPPPHFPLFPPHYQPQTAVVNDEWVFLNNFEQNYGVIHPFFYACRFIQALKIAQDEKKFVFLYLHSPAHPFTAEFCSQTLSSEIVVQFLDANFVSWGAIADRGEGLQMSGILRPASFPFSAVIAPASGDNIAVLQQEREKLKNIPPEQTVQKPKPATQASNRGISESPRKTPTPNKPNQVNESAATNRENLNKDSLHKGKNIQGTQILIRFPNGERREHSFSATDKVQAIYNYIDSLSLPGIGKYRLVSSFPRKVFGVDQKSMTLQDAGLYPRASLFLDIL
ncbi:Plant UBX domain-containing protein 10 [Bienertia sinuspersici]